MLVFEYIFDVNEHPRFELSMADQESYTAFDDGYHNLTSQESRSQTQNTQEIWCV
jgi:hypothetical protein